jgi:hypothetical protein
MGIGNVASASAWGFKSPDAKEQKVAVGDARKQFIMRRDNSDRTRKSTSARAERRSKVRKEDA